MLPIASVLSTRGDLDAAAEVPAAAGDAAAEVPVAAGAAAADAGAAAGASCWRSVAM